jgi:hypothetical protein
VLPVQVQVHGPVPLTLLAVLDEQREEVVGAAKAVLPSDHPHAPGASGAEQAALVPPFRPLQVQVQGPVPLTLLAVPLAQRPLLGAEPTATPLAEPQAPFMATGLPPSATRPQLP